MRQRNFRPIAPQRLFPDTTRPPHGVPDPYNPNRRYDRPTSPMRRGYPVQRPRGRTGIPRGLRGGLLRASRFFPPWLRLPFLLEDLDNWMWPDSPIQQPAGWQIPNGWTKCPQPDCADVWGGPDQGSWVGVSVCQAAGDCPVNVAAGLWGVTRFDWGTVHPTRRTVFALVHTSGNPHDNTARFTWVGQFVRDASLPTTMPEYKVGRVYLPEEFAEPVAEPQTRELTYGITKPKPRADSPDWAFADVPYGRPGVRPWSKPAIEIGPSTRPRVPPGVVPPSARPPGVRPPGGGVPPVIPHNPVPPRRPDREKKPFPKGIPYGEFGKWYGRVTEFNDMLDCLAESMGQRNPKGPTQKRALQVWNMMKENAPDAGAFAACMARENFQDMVIGRLNKAATRAVNRSPYASQRPGGYRGGGWGARMHNMGA